MPLGEVMDTTALSSAMRLNLLTQLQAETKQCRKAAAVGPNPMLPANSGQLMFTFPLCVAGACAHWRWHVVPPKAAIADGSQAPLGCCGLAGQP
jgi:hypothetical protein